MLVPLLPKPALGFSRACKRTDSTASSNLPGLVRSVLNRLAKVSSAGVLKMAGPVGFPTSSLVFHHRGGRALHLRARRDHAERRVQPDARRDEKRSRAKILATWLAAVPPDAHSVSWHSDGSSAAAKAGGAAEGLAAAGRGAHAPRSGRPPRVRDRRASSWVGGGRTRTRGVWVCCCLMFQNCVGEKLLRLTSPASRCLKPRSERWVANIICGETTLFSSMNDE